MRGNAYQVMEKYLAMARDASATGDRVSAENYYQHAEHYYRLLNANAGQDRNPQRDGNGRPREDQDGPNDPAQETQAQAQPPAQPPARPPAQPEAQPHTRGDGAAPADNGAEPAHGRQAPNGAEPVQAAEPSGASESTGGAEPANGSEPTEGSEQHQV